MRKLSREESENEGESYKENEKESWRENESSVILSKNKKKFGYEYV